MELNINLDETDLDLIGQCLATIASQERYHIREENDDFLDLLEYFFKDSLGSITEKDLKQKAEVIELHAYQKGNTIAEIQLLLKKLGCKNQRYYDVIDSAMTEVKGILKSVKDMYKN